MAQIVHTDVLRRFLRTPAWAFVLLGVAVRVWYGWGFGSPWLASDAPFYLADALHLLRHEAFVPRFPPGLPLLLAGWMALFGTSAISVEAMMIACYLVFSLLLWLLARHVAWIHAVFAIYPAFVHHSVIPLTHLPMAVCLLGAVYSLRALQGGQKAFFCAALLGVALGAGILVRPGSALVVVAAIAWMLCGLAKIGWGKRIALSATAVCVCALPVWLWMQHARSMTGKRMINSFNGYNVFVGNNPFAPRYKTWWLGSHEAADSAAFRQYFVGICPAAASPALAADTACESAYMNAALAHIQDRPLLFLERTAARVRTFFAFDVFAAGEWRDTHNKQSGAVFVLLVLDAGCYLLLLFGAALALRGGTTFEQKAFLAVVLAYACPYFLSFSHPTYHFPVMPILALLAVHGDKYNLVSLRGKSNRINSFSMIALVLLIIFIQAEWVFRWIVG